ncbi:MAG: MBOAT family protein [Bacteroidales bacterium]|nr:MBOAT family protein [Bacteroidales bacterium]
MVFSSSLFLLYFLPAFLVVYFLLPRRWKNMYALVASVVFYAWGAPDFILIVLGSIVTDFYLVREMSRSAGVRRNLLLALSLILNIGLLVYFKYANFMVDNLNCILSAMGIRPAVWVEVALPIGISFFTFQKLTYTVDVYRKTNPPLRHVRDYALYILMFPQLVAGPIVRFNEIAHQIEDRSANENHNNRLTGFFRFTVGLAKKVLIANVLGEQVDAIFSMPPEELGSGTAWLGIVAYAFQIYYDFSGYSDMAIGLGRMAGFDFPENFNNPYIAGSISEFWRRWHITLGRFMKDYLYIPLGGNRVPAARMFFNLWVVFLISGLWHGAAWNFVIWGAFHGLFLVADRLFLLKVLQKAGKIPSIIFTFLITLHGWVLFRADNITQAWFYIKNMYAFTPAADQYYFDAKMRFMLLLGGFFSFVAIFRGIEPLQEHIFAKSKKPVTLLIMTLASAISFIICLSSITSSGFNPFIYFRF